MTAADPTTRRVLLIAHIGREDSRSVARSFCRALLEHGLQVRLLSDEAAELGLLPDELGPAVEVCDPDGTAGADCELALVVGGDGTILRAAEITHAVGLPLLGVNLGHVGFLAEAEYDDIDTVIDAVVDRRYTLEDRLTIDVSVLRDGEVVASTFALNEASVEKAARERMLEVVVEIDSRPVSRWGCDGVVCATPTGSTAYNFSAGGPIVWPGVAALLMVPISAHALFARPMVVSPTSELAVEVLGGTGRSGVLWCDGRRTVDLLPGARIEVRRGASPVRIVRLHQEEFADKLVAKFGLPVQGWRGSSERHRRLGSSDARDEPAPVIEELRIARLGVIESSDLELGPGLTVITGETGAGKTMVVTALGLLLGGRGDAGSVRSGASGVRVEGRVRAGPDLAAAVREVGGEVEDDQLLLARSVSAVGRSRAFVGGAAVPVSTLAALAQPLVAVHGQSDQHRLLRPAAQRAALDRFGGDEVVALADAYADLHGRLEEVQRELAELTTSARERAREADLLRFGLEEVQAVSPESGEDAALAAEEGRLAHADSLRLAAEQAREALSGSDSTEATDGASDALASAAAARALLEGVRDHDAEAAGLADRAGELTYLLSDLAADVASYASRLETDPARLATVSERRAALAALTRKYGDSADDVLAWARTAAERLASLDQDDDRIAELRARRQRLRSDLADAGLRLSRARTEAARRLAAEVTAELRGLAMPHARLTVTVTQRPAPEEAAGTLDVDGRRLRYGRTGLDDVELLLSANAGAEPRPLHRGASGGELSRVMLALEVVLADTGPVPTFVFDEVDAGVGGRAALEVGSRLARLARSAQVLVVTHLPQVAAYADTHVVVEKEVDGSVTTAGLTVLDDAARVRELSRMLAGVEESASALAHARELLVSARGPGSALG